MNAERTTAIRPRLAHAIFATLWLAPAFAGATSIIINTYPDWDGNVTDSYLKVAQSFLAPAANSTLVSWKFSLAANATPTNVLFEIVRWDPSSGPSSAALFTRQVSWPAPGGDVLVSNINLPLTTATRYAAIVDLSGYRGKSVAFEFNQNSYDLGNAAWLGGLTPAWVYLDSTYNTEFQAEFYVVPEPGNLLCLGVTAVGVLRRRRRACELSPTERPSAS